MKISVFRSYPELFAAQAAGKFSKSQNKYIEITDDDYLHVLGDMNLGKTIMIELQGSERDIKDYMSVVRLKKGERMILRICASSNTAIRELDSISQLFSGNAYYCVYGIAFFDDMKRGEYTIDAVIKYEPQDDLRLN